MFAKSEPVRSADLDGAQAVKILIAGGFGVGKTTMVSAISEIKPLRTEERLSELGAAVDDLTGVGEKTTTTVALDFGRITINSEVVLYLFGTPGQDRFWFMWKELSVGALGAVVLADTRRLSDCFGSIDFFESRGIPFIVAVNCFDGADIYDDDEVRQALDIGAHVPVQLCDARDRASSKQVVVRLLEYLMATATALPDNHYRQLLAERPIIRSKFARTYRGLLCQVSDCYRSPARTDVMRRVLKPSQCIRPA